MLSMLALPAFLLATLLTPDTYNVVQFLFKLTIHYKPYNLPNNNKHLNLYQIKALYTN